MYRIDIGIVWNVNFKIIEISKYIFLFLIFMTIVGDEVNIIRLYIKKEKNNTK